LRTGEKARVTANRNVDKRLDRGQLRVALIGLGTVGQSTAKLVAEDPNSPIEFVVALVSDVHRERAVTIPVVDNLRELLEFQPDVVAEAAGHEALREHGPACLAASVPLVVLSTGALASAAFEQEMRNAARRGGATLTLASGGIGGLDILASAANEELHLVRHVITKRPSSFGVSAEKRTELFRGSAREAAQRYPQNANVAATVALAGVGLDRSETVIVADPDATSNKQELVVEGVFGRLRLELENRPSQTNPRTAAIVAMSLKHALEKLAAPVVVG
jgi:aspartate dehydrogenase